LKNIQADIKSGNFKQAYLLYGEEAYLKQQYKQNLIKALNPDGDTMNFSHYEGKGVDIKQLIDLCETMPFFADRRVILLEDTGFFKNKCEELADYMKELPDYLCLVFAESEVDKRNRMYKAVKACGTIAEFARQDEKTLMRWAAGLLGKAGKKITERYGTSSHQDRNRHGKSQNGVREADQLY
jgi:DNA polymerase-3 subunit delta